jgi:hypothetical protein
MGTDQNSDHPDQNLLQEETEGAEQKGISLLSPLPPVIYYQDSTVPSVVKKHSS